MTNKQINEVINKIITNMGISKVEDFWIIKKKLSEGKEKTIMDMLENFVSLETKIKTDDGECMVVVGGDKTRRRIQIGLTNHENKGCIKDYTFDEFTRIIRELKLADMNFKVATNTAIIYEKTKNFKK